MPRDNPFLTIYILVLIPTPIMLPKLQFLGVAYWNAIYWVETSKR